MTRSILLSLLMLALIPVAAFATDFKQCKKNADCTLISTGCGENWDAINKDYVDEYKQQVKDNRGECKTPNAENSVPKPHTMCHAGQCLMFQKGKS